MANINRYLLRLSIFALYTLALITLIQFGSARINVYAAQFNVADGVDTVSNDSKCSLSEAIQNINDQSAANVDCPAGDQTDGNGYDTINLPSGTIELSSDIIQIVKNINITGQGSGNSIIDAKTYNATFAVGQSISVNVFIASNFSIYNGSNSGIDSKAISSEINGIKLNQNDSQSGGSKRFSAESKELNINNIEIDGAGVANECDIKFTLIIPDKSEVREAVVRGCANSKFDSTLFTPNYNNPNDSSVDVSDIKISDSDNCQFQSMFNDSNSQIEFNINRVEITGCTDQINMTMLGDSQGVQSIKDVNIHDNNLSGGIGFLIGFSSALDRLSLERVSITNNTMSSNNSGGMRGIYSMINDRSQQSSIRNITVAGNKVASSGPISTSLVSAYGNPKTFSHITFANNQTPSDGQSVAAILMISDAGNKLGEIDDPRANENKIENSLIAGNTKLDSSSIQNADAILQSALVPGSKGGNISDDGAYSAILNDPTDQNNINTADLNLGTVSNHGGFVQTLNLMKASIAIDAGLPIDLGEDARGYVRPQGLGYDVGAYESDFTSEGAKGSSDTLAKVDSSRPNVAILAETGQNLFTVCSMIIFIGFSIVLARLKFHKLS
jgi:hypothetical protein